MTRDKRRAPVASSADDIRQREADAVIALFKSADSVGALNQRQADDIGRAVDKLATTIVQTSPVVQYFSDPLVLDILRIPPRILLDALHERLQEAFPSLPQRSEASRPASAEDPAWTSAVGVANDMIAAARSSDLWEASGIEKTVRSSTSPALSNANLKVLEAVYLRSLLIDINLILSTIVRKKVSEFVDSICDPGRDNDPLARLVYRLAVDWLTGQPLPELGGLPSQQSGSASSFQTAAEEATTAASPLPELDEVALSAVAAKAESYPWRDRTKHGFAWKMSPLDYVEQVYGEWLGKGLTQKILGSVDAKLYQALATHFSRHGRPPLSEFNLPTAHDVSNALLGAALLPRTPKSETARALTIAAGRARRNSSPS